MTAEKRPRCPTCGGEGVGVWRDGAFVSAFDKDPSEIVPCPSCRHDVMIITDAGFGEGGALELEKATVSVARPPADPPAGAEVWCVHEGWKAHAPDVSSGDRSFIHRRPDGPGGVRVAIVIVVYERADMAGRTGHARVVAKSGNRRACRISYMAGDEPRRALSADPDELAGQLDALIEWAAGDVLTTLGRGPARDAPRVYMPCWRCGGRPGEANSFGCEVCDGRGMA